MVDVLLILFLAYLCYSVWVAKDIPKSISMTYYLLGKDGWLFQVMLILLGVGIFIPWMKVSTDELMSLVFITCGGILFVAVSPKFKIRLDGIAHYIAAIVCGVAATLWVYLMGHGTLLIPTFGTGILLTLVYPKKYMMWAELSAIASVFSVLI